MPLQESRSRPHRRPYGPARAWTRLRADAILAMQLRRLAALERQKILDEHNELMRKIADYNDILAKPERQRKIVGDELDESSAK